ncbi:MAG: hypothetical protein FRX49_07516 [Trebouxia sp. A1-2]|nr:MAG: hypothetical protein FRX49_07516 [Trebouxia sp. A1-2]
MNDTLIQGLVLGAIRKGFDLMQHELLDGLVQPDGVRLPDLPSCFTMLQLDAVTKLVCMTCIAATHVVQHSKAERVSAFEEERKTKRLSLNAGHWVGDDMLSWDWRGWDKGGEPLRPDCMDKLRGGWQGQGWKGLNSKGGVERSKTLWPKPLRGGDRGVAVGAESGLQGAGESKHCSDQPQAVVAAKAGGKDFHRLCLGEPCPAEGSHVHQGGRQGTPAQLGVWLQAHGIEL